MRYASTHARHSSAVGDSPQTISDWAAQLNVDGREDDGPLVIQLRRGRRLPLGQPQSQAVDSGRSLGPDNPIAKQHEIG